MSEETTAPTEAPTPREQRRAERRNRGLRAAPPPAAMPAPPRVVDPNPEISAIIDQMQEENAAAGLTKAGPGEGTPLPGAPEIKVVKEEVEHDYGQNGKGTFTTLRGVVLRLKPFPHETATKIQNNMLPKRPMPPKEYIKADDKWVEKVSDPDYQEALGAYFGRAADIAFYVRVGMGTELHKDFPIPEDVWALDEDDWIDFIGNEELFGEFAIKAHREGLQRYIDWLQFYVLGEGDIRHLYQELDYASGVVRERVVQEAMDSFRRPD